MDFKVSELKKYPTGSILRIIICGEYPPGSEGNAIAVQMVSFVSRAIRDFKPAAIIFDFLHLNYTSGDAIGGIVTPLRRENGFIPSCIIAEGETAASLKSLLNMNSLLTIAGCRLFCSEKEGINYIELQQKKNIPPAPFSKSD